MCFLAASLKDVFRGTVFECRQHHSAGGSIPKVTVLSVPRPAVPAPKVVWPLPIVIVELRTHGDLRFIKGEKAVAKSPWVRKFYDDDGQRPIPPSEQGPPVENR